MANKTNLRVIYSQKGGDLFLASLLCLTALPSLCCIWLMMLLKNVLPFFVPWLMQGLGAALAFLMLGGVVVRLSGDENSGGQNEKNFLKASLQRSGRLLIEGGVWAVSLLLISYLARLGLSALFPSFFANQSWAVILAGMVFALIDCCVIALFSEKVLRSRGEGFRGGKFIIALFMIFISGYLLPIFWEMSATLTEAVQSSFMRTVAYLIVTALVQWVFCWPVLYKLAVSEQQMPEMPINNVYMGMGQPVQVPEEPKKAKGGIAIIVMAVLFVGCFFTQIPKGDQKIVLSQIHNVTAAGDQALANGDLLAAAAYYESAQLRKDAWYAALLDEGISSQSHGDSAINLLLMDDYYNENELYGRLIDGNLSEEYYIYYLESVKKEEKNGSLSEEDRNRQKEVLKYCALHGIWTGKTVTPEDFSDRQKQNTINLLNTYQDQLNARSVAIIYRDLAANGGVLTLEMVERAVALAEQYPDSLYLQGVAMQMAAGFTSDLRGNCYEQGIAAANRYDELFYQLNPDASDEEMAAERILVAKALIRCLDLEGAKSLLEKTLKQYQNEALWYTYASCLYRLEEYADCITVTSALYETYQSQSALGMRMLAQVLQEENEESLTLALQDALEISRYARESGDYTVADSTLFTLAQAFAGVSISNRDLYANQYRYFEEDDLALLAQDPLLESLVGACVHWQNREYEEGLAEINVALNMESEWSNLHYLKGSILFELKDYETAKNSFMISLECNRDNAATWFMLGHCYDRLKEYDLSANAFRLSNLLLPNSEHDLDYYGIGLHAVKAYEELQDYIDKGVRR